MAIKKFYLLARDSIIGNDLSLSLQIRLVDLVEKYNSTYSEFFVELIDESSLENINHPNNTIIIFNKTLSKKTFDYLYKNKENFKLIYDLDDLLSLWPSYSNYSGYSDYDFKKYYNLVDLVTIPSEIFRSNLINLYQVFEKLQVIETFLDFNKYINYSSKKYVDSSKILFANADSIKLSSSSNFFLKALYDICLKYNLELVNIGDTIFDQSRINVTNLGRMPFDQYMNFLNDNNFKFAVIPLSFNENFFDDIFNSTKSPVKYQQFGATKIPGIYSNSIVYSSLITHKKNGLLVNNSYENWFTAMEDFILDFNLRANISSNAFVDVITNHGIDAGCNKLHNVFKMILEK
jgi:hypothetical protein